MSFLATWQPPALFFRMRITVSVPAFYLHSTVDLPRLPETHGDAPAAPAPCTFPQFRAKSLLPLNPWPILLSRRILLLLQETLGNVAPGSLGAPNDVKYEHLNIDIIRPLRIDRKQEPIHRQLFLARVSAIGKANFRSGGNPRSLPPDFAPRALSRPSPLSTKRRAETLRDDRRPD